MRQIVLDTETTGLDPQEGHRVIEIGAVELISRQVTGRQFHKYIQPEREVDEGALRVHGITRAFLADKPVFRAIAREFLDFIKGAELVMHNAEFDESFLDHELNLLEPALGTIRDYCTVVDSFEIAKERHPGQRNSLDALCRRYQVDNSERLVHGALLDAELLAEVYLLLTGGQEALGLGEAEEPGLAAELLPGSLSERKPGPVILASAEELSAHDAFLELLAKEADKAAPASGT